MYIPCISPLTHMYQAVSKNDHYCFLKEVLFKRKKFILFFVAKVTIAFSYLSLPDRIKVLILDNSGITWNPSKAAELLVRVYDHVIYKYQKGFTMLFLQNKVIAIQRFLIRLTTILMVTKPKRKASWVNCRRLFS